MFATRRPARPPFPAQLLSRWLRSHPAWWVAAAFSCCVGGLNLLTAQPLRAQELSSARLAQYPLTERPSATGHTLALFWSGDGGWKELADDISKELVLHGVAVVGLNSRTWLTAAQRSPDSLSRDSAELLRHYLALWHRDRILLVGYSRGAGFAAMLATQLPADLRARVDGVVLLGMEHTASFEFHLMDLIRTVNRASDIPVKPYIARIAEAPVVCVYGTEEEDTVCPELDPTRVHLIKREGKHHFDGDYPGLTRAILTALTAGASRGPG